MQIHLWGQRNILGGGIHYSAFSDALRGVSGFGALVNEVDAYNPAGFTTNPTAKGDVNIFFVPPPEHVAVRGAIVKWGIFEADRLEEAYLEYLSDSNLVWVPSDWAKNVLLAHGLNSAKIDVIPEGVDASLFHPFLRRNVSKDDNFRFYMCGKYEERKGYPELLEGFKLAFGNSENVKLYLKADNFHSDSVRGTDKKSDLQHLLNSIGLTNVVLLSGNYSAADLALINSFVDAQIFSSRAEGWGLPLLEGIASGLPTICNFYSGQTQYLQEVKNQIRLLPHELKVAALVDNNFGYSAASGALWAVASPDEIATALLDVYEDYGSWEEKALLASNVVREKFSWLKSIECALESLKTKSIMKPEWSLGL